MKKLVLTLIVIISLCSTNYSQAADRYVVLSVNGDAGQMATLNVAAGEVAKLVFCSYFQRGNLPNSGFAYRFKCTIGGVEHLFQTPGHLGAEGAQMAAGLFTVPGPASITIGHAVNSHKMFATFRIQPNPNINGVGQ